MSALSSPHAVSPGDTGVAPAAIGRPAGWVDRRAAARIAGLGYVAIFVLAVFANFSVREGLVDVDDASATASNIAESGGLFRAGLVAFLAVFVIDIVVAWALHVVFRHDHHDVSLLAAWSRLAYTVFLGVAAIFFFQALAIYDATGLASTIGTAARDTEALLALEMFNATWLIGLAAFGLHLGVLGALIVRSGAAPRALGAVLMLAGAAYVIDTTAYALLSDYDAYATPLLVMVAVPSVIAEGWFGLWLLFRAGRIETDRQAGVPGEEAR